MVAFKMMNWSDEVANTWPEAGGVKLSHETVGEMLALQVMVPGLGVVI